jgi:hypothetical protein
MGRRAMGAGSGRFGGAENVRFSPFLARQNGGGFLRILVDFNYISSVSPQPTLPANLDRVHRGKYSSNHKAKSKS